MRHSAKYAHANGEIHIMKRLFVLALALFHVAMLTSCSHPHKHSYSVADCTHPAICVECGDASGEPLGHTVSVGVCERCREVQGEETIARLSASFAAIMELGTEMMDCINGIQSQNSDAQYAAFLNADTYVAAMKGAYEDLLEICGDKPEFERIRYQVKLLENCCPDATKGNSDSDLADQSILYQLYLRQISSSFNCFSEDMDYFAGTREAPKPIAYFAEVPEMPTPDSVIYGITFDSKNTTSGTIQYTYLLDSDETNVNIDYNLYLLAVGTDDTLKINIYDSYVSVEKNGSMVSAMMAGNDVSKGYFLTISFQQ